MQNLKAELTQGGDDFNNFWNKFWKLILPLSGKERNELYLPKAVREMILIGISWWREVLRSCPNIELKKSREGFLSFPPTSEDLVKHCPFGFKPEEWAREGKGFSFIHKTLTDGMNYLNRDYTLPSETICTLVGWDLDNRKNLLQKMEWDEGESGKVLYVGKSDEVAKAILRTAKGIMGIFCKNPQGIPSPGDIIPIPTLKKEGGYLSPMLFNNGQEGFVIVQWKEIMHFQFSAKTRP